MVSLDQLSARTLPRNNGIGQMRDPAEGARGAWRMRLDPHSAASSWSATSPGLEVMGSRGEMR